MLVRRITYALFFLKKTVTPFFRRFGNDNNVTNTKTYTNTERRGYFFISTNGDDYHGLNAFIFYITYEIL